MFKAPKLNFETQFYWVLKEPYYFRLNHSPRLTPLAEDLDLDSLTLTLILLLTKS